MADAAAAPPPDSGAAPVQAVAASVACVTASVMPGFLAGALGSDIKAEFGIGDTGLGVALALTYIFAAVAIVHAGELSDRIGSRRSLTISMLVTMAGYLVVAGAARSFAMLLVGLTVAGAGLTLAGPAAKVLVADHVSPERQGLAFGVHMSAIPLGPLLAGLTVPVVGGTDGWRWPFLGGAVLAGAGMLMLPRERAAAPSAARPSRDPAAGRFGHVRKGPQIVFAAAAKLASCSVVAAAAFFVVNSEAAGISESTAGLLLSAASAGVITVRIALGALADRFRTGAVSTVAMLLTASAAGYALMAANTPWLYALGGQAAIILGWSWPGLMVLALVRIYPEAPGLASSFVIGGLNLGAVIGPVAFGAISDAASPAVALAVAAAWVLGAAVLSLASRIRLDSSRSPSPA
ncbi:MAG: MFS transporter [Acidimicrobiaceae bacterium]|nr:MFS transporter [Acidimicrobiaceae bacterium]